MTAGIAVVSVIALISRSRISRRSLSAGALSLTVVSSAVTVAIPIAAGFCQ
jgi:hypothetical protein